jgi:hypothetical protein
VTFFDGKCYKEAISGGRRLRPPGGVIHQHRQPCFRWSLSRYLWVQRTQQEFDISFIARVRYLKKEAHYDPLSKRSEKLARPGAPQFGV